MSVCWQQNELHTTEIQLPCTVGITYEHTDTTRSHMKLFLHFLIQNKDAARCDSKFEQGKGSNVFCMAVPLVAAWGVPTGCK